MKQIVLFGARGMLGRYVENTLKNSSMNVIKITRNIYNILDNDHEKLKNILKPFENGILINCAGAIPQRNTYKDQDFFVINSLFPKTLESLSKSLNMKFLHISTNCVFNGETGNYDETSLPDAIDPYGLSKYLGEPSLSCIIRTSIIGEEEFTKKSFIEWVKSNKNKTIHGYTNCYWNGCTCLELSNYIENIIKNDLYWTGVKHVFSSETVSKYDLACIVNDVYDLNITIIPKEHTMSKNMTLSSIYDNTIVTKPIKTQIIDMKMIEFDNYSD